MSPACCPMTSRLVRGLVIVLALSLTSFGAVGEDAAKKQDPPKDAPTALTPADPAKQPGPRAEYTAEQVVQIVMDALQNNDEHDSGIVTTFNFASPGNKKFTGPVSRFIPMVKTPAYQPMLNFDSADYGKLELSEDKLTAEQVVTVIAADGTLATYVFHLSKQKDGEFKDCWMTDGVVRVERKGKQA